MKRGVYGAVGLALLVATPGRAMETPLAVSPGSESSSLFESRCPTFTWDPVLRAAAHELVVYEVGAGGREAEPVLARRIPGAAPAWTPPLEDCLERGGRYAWAVRAVDLRGRASAWSSPSLFQVAPAPDAAEVRAILRSYFEAGGTPAELAGTGLESGLLAASDSGPGSTPGPGAPPGARASSPKRGAATTYGLVAAAAGSSSAGLFQYADPTAPIAYQVELGARGMALSVSGGAEVDMLNVSTGFELSTNVLEYSSGSDTVPESYELTALTCTAGQIDVLKPSAATTANGPQDSLCYCGTVEGRTSWWCFNP